MEELKFSRTKEIAGVFLARGELISDEEKD